MKVAIYTRVSGKSNRQDAANQSLQLVEFCQRQGWEYVEYHCCPVKCRIEPIG
jgi:DNA invertase Pin-like site-specific DNA recombinase